jgi:hypothetical protein
MNITQVWQLSSEICHREGGLKIDGRSAVKIVVDGIERPLADVIYKQMENTLYLVAGKEGDKCLTPLAVLKG